MSWGFTHYFCFWLSDKSKGSVECSGLGGCSEEWPKKTWSKRAPGGIDPDKQGIQGKFEDPKISLLPKGGQYSLDFNYNTSWVLWICGFVCLSCWWTLL